MFAKTPRTDTLPVATTVVAPGDPVPANPVGVKNRSTEADPITVSPTAKKPNIYSSLVLIDVISFSVKKFNPT